MSPTAFSESVYLMLSREDVFIYAKITTDHTGIETDQGPEEESLTQTGREAAETAGEDLRRDHAAAVGWHDPAYTILQGAYKQQRVETQKWKGEERKQNITTYLVFSLPTASTSSPSSTRALAGPQRPRCALMSGPAWTSVAGFAYSFQRFSHPTSTSSARTSTVSTPPISESEWARRQAEQAKEEQERFRLEQEKKENQRLAEEANKQLAGKDLVQLYQHHEARWKDLNTFDVLRWDYVPVVDDLRVSVYQILPRYHKSEKDRVKEHTKYLSKVIEDARRGFK